MSSRTYPCTDTPGPALGSPTRCRQIDVDILAGGQGALGGRPDPIVEQAVAHQSRVPPARPLLTRTSRTGRPPRRPTRCGDHHPLQHLRDRHGRARRRFARAAFVPRRPRSEGQIANPEPKPSSPRDGGDSATAPTLTRAKRTHQGEPHETARVTANDSRRFQRLFTGSFTGALAGDRGRPGGGGIRDPDRCPRARRGRRSASRS